MFVLIPFENSFPMVEKRGKMRFAQTVWPWKGTD